MDRERARENRRDEAIGDDDGGIDRAHDVDALGADLSATFDEIHVDGFLLEETVLVHKPSKTLAVADLVHNIGRPTATWTKLYTQAMGFYDRVAISRVIRWTAFRDRRAARSSVDRILTTSFDRVTVGHGEVIEGEARCSLANAYEWLRPSDAALALPNARRGYCG